jgi:hypothetical protein
VVSPTYPQPRDDAPLLRQIAAGAKAWYGTPRASLELAIRRFSLAYRPGSYVSDVFGANIMEDINCVVSQRTWDFGKDLTTGWQTSHCELDFAGEKQDLPPLKN